MIEKIFETKGFERSQHNSEDRLSFFSKSSGDFKEYYLVDQVQGPKLKDYVSTRFEEVVLPFFQEKCNTLAEIEKNTSLIVLADFEDALPSSRADRNKIILVEEDPYYFRKYVIAYKNALFEGLLSADSPETKIWSVLSDEQRYQQFEDNALNDEEYFVAMQLQTKLAFLTIKDLEKEMKGVRETVSLYLQAVNSSLEKATEFGKVIQDPKLAPSALESAIIAEEESDAVKLLFQIIDDFN